jgi:hypothetical protein
LTGGPETVGRFENEVVRNAAAYTRGPEFLDHSRASALVHPGHTQKHPARLADQRGEAQPDGAQSLIRG